MNRRKPPTVLILQWPHRVHTTHATVLRASGLDVLEVNSSTAALNAARTMEPDVIIAMHNSRFAQTCADLCQAMKADCHLADIPILLVSDLDVSEDDMRLATDVGVLALTVSDGDSPKLLAAINGVLAAHRASSTRQMSPVRRRDVKRLA